MTVQALSAIVLSAMALIGRPERVPPSPEIANAIALAVLGDVEGRLTGSVEGDAVYEATETFHETRWGWRWDGRAMVHDDCPEHTDDDGTTSYGYFQMKRPRDVACNAGKAAIAWTEWAHKSQARCAALPLAEQLAELHSGTCARGHVVSRYRWSQAASALALVSPDSSPLP